MVMTFKDFKLTDATNRDTHEIKRIVFTVLKEYGLPPDEYGKDSDLNDIEHNYIFPNGFFGIVIHVNSNEIIGTIGLYPLDKDTCELRKMYLLKHLRGQGLGKFLLQSVIEIARQKGYMKISLDTIAPLKEAISLYTKAGFREVTPQHINDRVDRAFEMELTQPNKT